MEPSPQRHCPHCGTPVAHKAESCLMCGSQLKEEKKRSIRLPQGDVAGPLLIVAAVIAIWLWRPWETGEPQAIAPAPASVTPTATALPSATYAVAPTATPLHSPTPPPTATLPPNQTRHTVESGQTVTSIAKHTDNPVMLRSLYVDQKSASEPLWKAMVLGSVIGALLVVCGIYVWEDARSYRQHLHASPS